MSRYLCSHCGANRGEARYDNGTYCFSCHKKSNNNNFIVRTISPKQYLEMPKDLVDEFTYNVKLWLNKYYLNQSVRIIRNIKWSPSLQRIVFISFNLTHAWMRSIIEHEKNKWLFVGSKEKEPYYWTVDSNQLTDSLVI